MADSEPEVRVLTAEELSRRSKELAFVAVNQCSQEDSGSFILISSMGVLLDAAAVLATMANVETDAALRIFASLIRERYEARREGAN